MYLCTYFISRLDSDLFTITKHHICLPNFTPLINFISNGGKPILRSLRIDGRCEIY